MPEVAKVPVEDIKRAGEHARHPAVAAGIFPETFFGEGGARIAVSTGNNPHTAQEVFIQMVEGAKLSPQQIAAVVANLFPDSLCQGIRSRCRSHALLLSLGWG